MTNKFTITEALVSDLIASQFSQWKNLPIRLEFILKGIAL